MTSCNDVIQLELDDPEPVLVVDGFVSNVDTVQYVKLSSLDNYFASQPPNYSLYQSASVSLRENEVTIGTYVFNTDTERFELQFKGLTGKEYQLHVSLPDGTSYLSASEIMEETTPIDSIWYEVAEVDSPTSEEGDYTVLINTKEPVGTGDNYQWKSYINGEYNFEATDVTAFDDRFVDGQWIIDFDVYSLNEKDYLKYKSASPSGQVLITIEQARISLRYFDYITLVTQQLLQVGSPFASPPAEIRGNVYKEGEEEVLALGYFYTSALDAATVDVIEQ
ncbi:MAG: hypothetical protein ACJAWO_001156 [Halieaceae bacterium]|jgi:hypothetical protein